MQIHRPLTIEYAKKYLKIFVLGVDYCLTKKYNNYVRQKEGEKMPGKPKIGRPTTDPKNLRVTVRFNDEQSQKIKDYSIKNNLTTSQVIRKAVDLLK